MAPKTVDEPSQAISQSASQFVPSLFSFHLSIKHFLYDDSDYKTKKNRFITQSHLCMGTDEKTIKVLSYVPDNTIGNVLCSFQT